MCPDAQTPRLTCVSIYTYPFYNRSKSKGKMLLRVIAFYLITFGFTILLGMIQQVSNEPDYKLTNAVVWTLVAGFSFLSQRKYFFRKSF